MACSMTMCGIMLESLLESSSEFVNHAQEAEFITRCHAFCTRYPPPYHVCLQFAILCDVKNPFHHLRSCGFKYEIAVPVCAGSMCVCELGGGGQF